MRNFLTDIKIAGALLVARCGDILHQSIPNLLKWCDFVLIMLDNEDEYTLNIVEHYKNKYPDRIRISHSGFPRATPKQENSHRGLFHRFKPLQGPIRETVFKYFRDLETAGERIDIIIWPDSDEIFSNSFPELLTKFWAMPEKLAITMKPVDVFGDMMTIHNRSMTGHTRVFKYFKELTAIPYRTACYHRPLTKQNRIGDNRTLIHLCSLTPEKRAWRAKHWKPNSKLSQPLWKLPGPVYEMTPQELREILHKAPDLTVEDFIRGGDKRKPMGVENAYKALFEASTLLDEIGVRHYLAFGTCLLITRDGSISPYDWDIDLISLAEDNKKLEKSVDKLKSAGFTEFKRKQDIPKWKKQDGTVSEEKYVRTYSFKKYGCRIDIDPLYKGVDDTKLYVLKGRKRDLFVGEAEKSWFDNAKEIEFNGKKYKIPNPVEDYLYSQYGTGWNIPAYGPMSWNKRPCKRNTWELI